MNRYIVLLRGVNVGGKNILPMKALKSALGNAGFSQVKTYIQSGNIILYSDADPEAEVAAVISAEFDFTPEIMALTNNEFLAAIANNPYPGYEGKFVHFYFCKSTPQPDFKRLEGLAADTERFTLVDNVFYLYAPEGVARSKLAAGAGKYLGIAVTARNLNTVNKLSTMLEAES